MKFGDIPAAVTLFEEMHRRSVYADRAKIDTKELKALLMGSIQRHGHKTVGGTCCLVAEGNKSGVLSGLLIGVLDRAYHILDGMMATDLFYFTSEQAGARDAIRLFDAFEAWAQGNPNVIEIKLGAPDVVDPNVRVGALYERRGYRQCGFIFERSVGP